jgi:hypothetical protein
LEALGGVPCQSVAEVVKKADIIFSSVCALLIGEESC